MKQTNEKLNFVGHKRQVAVKEEQAGNVHGIKQHHTLHSYR